jgi:adenylylsulfate kinase
MTRPAFAVWMTGLPASGKSTVARALVEALEARGVHVAVLESDVLRPIFTPHATYRDEEREMFYRMVAYVGGLLVRHSVPVIFDATANRRSYRDGARSAIDRFIEVYVECPLEVCVARDPKGLYRQARAGVASHVPGLQTSYEAPERPDVVVSGTQAPEASAHAVIRALEGKGYLDELASDGTQGAADTTGVT